MGKRGIGFIKITSRRLKDVPVTENGLWLLFGRKAGNKEKAFPGVSSSMGGVGRGRVGSVGAFLEG